MRFTVILLAFLSFEASTLALDLPKNRMANYAKAASMMDMVCPKKVTPVSQSICLQHKKLLSAGLGTQSVPKVVSYSPMVVTVTEGNTVLRLERLGKPGEFMLRGRKLQLSSYRNQQPFFDAIKEIIRGSKSALSIYFLPQAFAAEAPDELVAKLAMTIQTLTERFEEANACQTITEALNACKEVTMRVWPNTASIAAAPGSSFLETSNTVIRISEILDRVEQQAKDLIPLVLKSERLMACECSKSGESCSKPLPQSLSERIVAGQKELFQMCANNLSKLKENFQAPAVGARISREFLKKPENPSPMSPSSDQSLVPAAE